ncbi:nucleoside deaminase [Larsenimonas salina]|uniref:nucleoside deaminase n=1 Tax=Larsenimonas salina TaxID=1295565 RepID=UPI002074A0FD|nr:nucleoside deaminase [Larsenimonas salina]MCM5703578.1 nucleoside deaminase [Larsenimonas salina]
MDEFMKAALDEARQGFEEGGVPIGSVLVHQGRILGRGRNQRVQKGSAVLHGEMSALEHAGRLPAEVYRACTLYTTLSPCPMCSGAIELYGIKHVVIGENTTFMGAESALEAKGVRLEVLDDPECKHLMARFIDTRPDIWFEDIGEDVGAPRR